MPLTGPTINLSIDVIMHDSECSLSALEKLVLFDKYWENSIKTFIKGVQMGTGVMFSS